MKYCIITLLVLIFIIIFHNLLNYNTIETFHSAGEEITKTDLQKNIDSAIENIGSAINQYKKENIVKLKNEVNSYGSRLTELTNIWEEGTNAISTGSSCKYDEKISLDKFTKYEGLTCDFEKPCDNNDTNYEEHSTINRNPKSLQECADSCNDATDCIAFSYKDKLNDQVCRLSSVCTDKNANKNEDYTLYVDENINYSNFPLSNYKIDYNKKCKTDVYAYKQNYTSQENITKDDCARECNNDSNCIAFEYEPSSTQFKVGTCKKQSDCYTNGCLESSGSDADFCNNTSLYSKKVLIPDNTKVPDYINCDVCENNKTIYNTNFLRLYTDEKIGRADLVYSSDISKLQASNNESDILENILYYRITNGYQVKLFQNENFKGKHLWLYPTFERKAINTIGEEELNEGIITQEEKIDLQKFRSFKIYSDSKANLEKQQCVGYWGDCDYDNLGNLKSEWIVLKDKDGDNILPCPNENQQKNCNRDSLQYIDWDISSCVTNAESDDALAIQNLKGKKYPNVYPLLNKSGKGNPSKPINQINYPVKDCTEEDYNNNDICDYGADWTTCNANNQRTRDHNHGQLKENNTGICSNTKSCIWEAYGTYEGTYSNNTYKVEINSRPTDDNGNEDRSLEIFNYITMYKNGVMATTNILSNEHIPRHEDRDIIIFGSRFKNDVAKSYILHKKYTSNYSESQNNSPSNIKLEIVNDGIKFNLYRQ